jgi:DNA-binding NarL/FixJ family response regulator
VLSIDSTDKKVKVLVVDDHVMVAEGTVLLLATDPGIAVVGTAKNGQECINEVRAKKPDVVLLDINLPDICGSDLVDKLKEINPGIKIIMLTGQNPQEYITVSLGKGAQGFLLKDCSKNEMTQAIFTVNQGNVYFSQSMGIFLRSVMISKQENAEREQIEGLLGRTLTGREQEIMTFVAKGLHNKEIAAQLGIKARTVDFHVSNILLKFGVSSRLEAVLSWTQGDKKQ